MFQCWKLKTGLNTFINKDKIESKNICGFKKKILIAIKERRDYKKLLI